MKFNNKEYNIKIWEGEVLGKYVALDTETTIAPFTETPDLVTIQAYSGGTDVYYIPKSKISSFLDLHTGSIFLFLNAPFDISTIAKEIQDSNFPYRLYDDNRCRDIGVMYRLLHLAVSGFVPFKYNLSFLAEKFLGKALVKDERRENFAQFLNKEITEIPEEYLEYGAIDVIATYDIYFKILPQMARHDRYNTLLSHDIQVKGDWALKQIYKNGIGFDLEARDAWLKDVDSKLETQANILASWGWVRGKKGIKDQYEKVIDLLGISLPRTESGEMSSKSDDLEPYRGYQFIDSLLTYRELEKAASFVRDNNTSRIHPKYNLLVNTGRTSSSQPNIQQVPKIGGIREMYIPKKGCKLIDVDYSAIELSGLAQVCLNEFGYSTMAEKINEGKCLHYYTASMVYRKPEDEVTKEERQFAKIPNFAFPTNMSPNTFIDYCRGYNVPMTLKQATDLKKAYALAYPEISREFWNIGNETDVYTLTGRKRANCSYTAYLNTKFQGLCADGLKIALYNLCKQGYTIVCQVHDQIVIEIDENLAEAEMPKIEKIMVESMREVIPDVRVSTEGQILDRWTK
jgi:DNA polymerase-1